ncbi:MAG: ThiF family adenylyltransferase [Candidatus Heimdallarchaeota archaeon]
MLSEEEKILYSRQIILPDFGEEGQVKLKKARVLVVGLGGLGTFSSLLLAELGIGYLRLVDQDIIEVSNLHRQPLYTHSDLERAKVEVAAERLRGIHPSIVIDSHATHVNEANADEILRDIDIVIDGLDNFETRRVLNQVCLKKGIPFIFCGVSARSGNLTTFNLNRDSPCLSCIYHGVDDVDVESCDITGIHPALLPIITGLQVYEAVEIIIGNKSNLNGSLLFVDLPQMTFDHISIRKNPTCPVCAHPRHHLPVSSDINYRTLELCGEDNYMIVPIIRKSSLDIPSLSSKIEKVYKLKLKGKLSITFFYDEKVLITLFKGGNALIRGMKDPSKVMSIWDKISQQFIE